MTYVIAEAGSNHNGKLKTAYELIEVAAKSGCDAVKFQCLSTLPREWMPKLKNRAYACGVDCFASAFDVDAIHQLAELRVPYIKIASPEIVRQDLLNAAAATGIPLIVSTGMATKTEVREAVRLAAGRITLLQCTTRYPTPPDQVNLRAMVTLRHTFGAPVGLSDHTLSTTIPAAAVAMGAAMIEKHFTLDRSQEGPDHPFALEPSELATMVAGIREVEQAMGDGRKDGPVEGEWFQARGRRLQWVPE